MQETSTGATEKGGSCYDPDRPVHHASFAMNAYYQKMGRNQWNCDFNNTSLISLGRSKLQSLLPICEWRIRTSTATGKGGNSNPNRYLVCA
ncbi:unnamed protein product [Prunus armeniaca]